MADDPMTFSQIWREVQKDSPGKTEKDTHKALKWLIKNKSISSVKRGGVEVFSNNLEDQ